MGSAQSLACSINDSPSAAVKRLAIRKVSGPSGAATRTAGVGNTGPGQTRLRSNTERLVCAASAAARRWLYSESVKRRVTSRERVIAGVFLLSQGRERGDVRRMSASHCLAPAHPQDRGRQGANQYLFSYETS